MTGRDPTVIIRESSSRGRDAAWIGAVAMEDRDTPIDDVPLVSKQVVRGADRLTAVPREVARQLEMLEAVARRTGNAVIVTDPRGRIEWVNEGFRRLTGYEASDALGHRPAELLQGPDTSVEVRRQMGAAISAGRPFDVVVLNYKKTGEQYWVHIEAEPTRDATGSLNGYIALETDVTERRIAEGREDLAKRISDGLLQATCVEEACRIITTELVGTLDVRTAQAWTVEPGSPTLRYVTGARADEAGQGWLDVSSSREFRRGTEWVVGVGAPGVAWGTGLPCVKVDFWEQDNNGQYSRRAEAARLGGIRTVLAAPVKGPDGVVAVLEVGGSHRYPGHDRLPALLEYVARQLAAFLARHESRTAFEALFQSSPDALLVLDDLGVVTAANRRAEEMFQEVNGRSIMTLLEHGEFVSPGKERAPDAPSELHTCTAVRADGSRFSAEVSLSPSRRGGRALLIAAVRDLSDRERAAAALQRSLDEKLTLVQEVHHRVKNNLQIISSLITLQSEEMEDAQAQGAMMDTARRIQSMAFVHQQLYASDDLSRIDFGDYARSLCAALRDSMAPDAELHVVTEPCETPIERAVPAGLILNELLTNAFKHGRSDDGALRIEVEVRRGEGGYTFVVADHGRGIGTGHVRQGSMGQTLIRSLLRQLRAKRTDVDQGRGSRIEVAVPDEDP